MQFDTDKLVQYFSDAPEDISLSDINLETIPSHVSIIMDGTVDGLRLVDLIEPKVIRPVSFLCARLLLLACALDWTFCQFMHSPQKTGNVLSVRLTCSCVCLQRRFLKSFHLFHQENV